VNGDDALPLFKYLKFKLPGIHPDSIEWNFTKFLIDRNGKPVSRKEPAENPLSFRDEIEDLLNEKINS